MDAQDIAIHKRKYPSFNDKRLVDWLNETKRWAWYKTVSQASKGFRRHLSFTKWCEQQDD